MTDKKKVGQEVEAKKQEMAGKMKHRMIAATKSMESMRGKGRQSHEIMDKHK